MTSKNYRGIIASLHEVYQLGLQTTNNGFPNEKIAGCLLDASDADTAVLWKFSHSKNLFTPLYSIGLTERFEPTLKLVTQFLNDGLLKKQGSFYLSGNDSEVREIENNQISLLTLPFDVGIRESFAAITLARSNADGYFSADDIYDIKHVAGVLSGAIENLNNKNRLTRYVEKFQANSQNQIIWSEALGWLIHAQPSIDKNGGIAEYYKQGLFQARMITKMAWAAIIFLEPSRELGGIIVDSCNKKQISLLVDYFKSELAYTAELNSGADIYELKTIELKSNDSSSDIHKSEQALIAPLIVGDKNEGWLIVGADKSHFTIDEYSKMNYLVFTRGIGNVAERHQLLCTLKMANEKLKAEKEEQKILISRLEETQHQLLQSEKMASIGQLAAGVAHEINNPIGFINSNLSTLNGYILNIYQLLDLYDQVVPDSIPGFNKIEQLKEETEYKYIREDTSNLLSESSDGIERVKCIVQDLKDFSRVDEGEWQWANLQNNIDSTLNIVSSEVKYKAEIMKDYQNIPDVECMASQLNQVFLNMLINAAHAIPVRGIITIRTYLLDQDFVVVEFEDNGSGIDKDKVSKIFDPFFTTKPIGIGTGLGLSVSYGIVEKHKGKIEVFSSVGVGTKFVITLPINRNKSEE